MKIYLQQLEITFWTLAIPLMSDSKMVQSLLRKTYAVYVNHNWKRFIKPIFTWLIVSIYIGLIGGMIAEIIYLPRIIAANHISISLFSKNHKPTYPVPASDPVKDTSFTNDSHSSGRYPDNQGYIQQNILLIAVDQLQSQQPLLEGIWLMLYIRGNPHITFMPIYPEAITLEGLNKDQSNNGKLEPFFLESDHSPSTIFLDKLKSQGFWWSGYVVLDRTAIAMFIDYFSSQNLGFKNNQNDPYTISGLPSTGEDTRIILRNQSILIRGICEKTRTFHPHPENLFSNKALQNHISTDFDFEYFIKQWVDLAGNGGGIYCEFPAQATDIALY